ncbi:MAG: RecQ family ATP-dependent DNA helicase [Desulfobacterales bacterium]|nr:RecQ family ATP-dependent DNA helicase [Desulfobacterales bacterium]
MTAFKNILCLDLESVPNGKIFHLGALLNNKKFERRDISSETQALKALADFGQDADSILGHNICNHDIPLIRERLPQASFLEQPVIDTLFLSPLAFPENPYHKLIKDYKLVKSGKNDPVADARLTIEILRDQVDAFLALEEGTPNLLKFYAFALGLEKKRPQGAQGNALIIEGMAGGVPSHGEARQLFQKLCKGKACPRALKTCWDSCWNQPRKRPLLAYLVSWLQVAGGNSILPPWVKHEFPRLDEFIQTLRYSCGDSNCDHCRKQNDAPSLLKRYFGFEAYRPMADGTPLQQDIVEAGLGGKSLLAILPTGGGKSICYQIPALHRFHRTGALSIVITPLKALMKDQVDNLNRTTGTEVAATINGGLTLPERGATMERVRLGDVGILYISPEQLRNQSIAQLIQGRDIGYWIFDEAHCLSKWGHDFRPDYIHVTEFILKLSQRHGHIPRVGAFTATAKKDVTEEILDHFQSVLDLKPTHFQGGVHRDNLELWVQAVTPSEKNDQIVRQIKESLEKRGGAAIVYCNSKRGTEKMARFLQEKQIQARAFHSQIKETDKQEIQDEFSAGNIPVICATNAFGMGIDKQDIRLVIHADIPGSLENYLQEAGRAGRDQQDSDCILCYEPDDIDLQFALAGRSKVSQKEIQKILRFLRKRGQKTEKIIITPGEIMASIGHPLDDETTKAHTAVSWLERKGFIHRDFNQTLFFQGRPRVKNLEAAQALMDNLDISQRTRQFYTRILSLLFNIQANEAISADHICTALGQTKNPSNTHVDSRQVMILLSDMARIGLIREGTLLSAFIRPKGKNNAPAQLETFIEIETAMVQAMEELSPEAGTTEERLETFNLRRMAQRLKDQGLEQVTPNTVDAVLRSLAQDRGKSKGKSMKIMGRRGMDRLGIHVKFPWETLKQRMALRHLAARIAIRALIDKLPKGQQASRAELLVDFFLTDLTRKLAAPHTSLFDDAITTALTRADHVQVAEAVLLYLHDLNIIRLQNGLGVFRQAFTLGLNPHAKGRGYLKGDYQALSHHYDQKNAQIHVMEKFARLGLEKPKHIYTYIRDYFSFSFDQFTDRYFPGEEKIIKTAMTGEAYRNIIQSLNNPVQESIVAAAMDKNILVLAGPGSGKTRTIVHRCAWLIKAQSVMPEAILVLCFNHRAMLELRRRIQNLTGPAGRGITVMTYHGFAMRLTGRSFLESGEMDFSTLIQDATALLNGEQEVAGMAPDDAREHFLAGFRYILVDEYQDIDQEQYRFISALTGRLTEDKETKISIMAVGDDDQSIYKFRQANLKFIHQFREDYHAEPVYLLENYRSAYPIVETANAFISQNRDRMKKEHPCRINGGRSREILPPDQIPPAQRVQIVHAPDPASQACFVAETIQALMEDNPDLTHGDVAVVSRTGLGYPALVALRMALARLEIPFSRTLKKDQGFPLFRAREIQNLLDYLELHSNDTLEPKALKTRYLETLAPENPWTPQLASLLEAWCQANTQVPITLSLAREFILELLLEERRDHRMGKGVSLGTVHSVKGMEFPVVFILDGGWQNRDMEEERRLFYVGMTRAEQRLYLIRTQDDTPHIPFLENSPFCRVSQAPPRSLRGFSPTMTISILGMGDLYLGYPARYPENSPIHTHLSTLIPGDRVKLIQEKERIFMVDNSDFKIAALSKKAARVWRPLLGSIINARILAMVRRTREDGKENQPTDISYPDPKLDSWEIPIVEILHQAPFASWDESPPK